MKYVGNFRLIAIYLSLLVLVIYSNTLSASWHWDDLRLFEDIEIKSFSKIIMSLPSYGRAIGDLTFAVNYRIGRSDPFTYHLVNIFFHILTGLSVFVLIKELFNGGHGSSDYLKEKSDLIAFWVTTLFLVHPVQTQAVTYIIQRYSILVTLFYLLTLIFFLKYKRDDKGSKRYYIISIFFAFLAIHTKQNAFILPFVILFLESVYFKSSLLKRTTWVRLSPFFFLAFLIPARIIWPEFFSLTHDNLSSHLVDLSTTAEKAGSISGFFSKGYTFLFFVEALLWPVHLTIHHGFVSITTIWHIAVISAYILIGILIAIAIYTAKKYPLLCFGIFFFLITPSIEVFWPGIENFYEHWAYLASIGMILSFVYALFLLAKNEFSEKIIVAILVLLTLTFSYMTYSRNFDWKTEGSLWKSAYETNPDDIFITYSYGRHLMESGNPTLGCSYIKKSNDRKEHYFPVMRLMAQCLTIDGKYDDAENYILKALSIWPHHIDSYRAYLTLVDVYTKKGDSNKVFWAIRQAQSLNPNSVESQNLVGIYYMKIGSYEKALSIFKKNIKLFPQNPLPYHYGGIALERLGRLKNAKDYFMKSIAVDPDYRPARLSLADLQKNDKKRM